MTTKYILIYTDFGDTCDGLAREAGVFDTREQAVEEMKGDNITDTIDSTDKDTASRWPNGD